MERASAHLDRKVFNFCRESYAGKRALVVDDSPVNRKVAALQLARLGFDVTIAADAFEALDRIHQKNFDLIVLDVVMPGMNGTDLAHLIRTTLPAMQRHVTILGWSTAVSRTVCLGYGMDDVLPKPLHQDSIVKALRRCHFDLKPATRVSSSYHPSGSHDPGAA